MSRTRTTVMLDDELVTKARRIYKADSVSDVLERSLREAIRRDSLKQLAEALRAPSTTDEHMTGAPRRRPA